MSPEFARAEQGVLIAVVGPSGSGKDTLIDYAQQRLASEAGVTFVRRVVTRLVHAGSEDHDTLSDKAFLAAKAAGRFAVTWQAHGLSYAIPAAIRAQVASGGVAVVNGSRAALPAIRDAFGHVQTIRVTCRPDVLAARLAARGRETAKEQQRRLARAETVHVEDAVEIDNSGDVATAGDALVAIIRAFVMGVK